MKNLVLIGFMGSGKSTVGRLVAEELGLQFVDVDRLIEEREGIPISEIFSKFGEKRFRELETKTVQELATRQNQVLATGGGVVLRPENLQALKSTGILILLHVDASTAYTRTKDHHHRPLLQTENPLAQIQELLQSREALYHSIPNTVETLGRTPNEVVRAVIRIYKAHQD